MFDAITRFETMNGVVACVKGNKQSIDAVSSLTEHLHENSTILQKAISKPNSTGARKILHTIVPYLQFASRNIQYGFFQNHQVKPKIQETCKHYGSYTAFITLSFNDTENPISYQASFHTITNTQFPAIFEPNSIHGTNGSEFMQNLLAASVEEASVNVPIAIMGRDARVQAAMDNPVAYVMESKRLLLDFLSVLLGKSPEGFFNYDETTSARRTRYF